ncbi:MAG: threonine aldolase family protein [Bryobacteraceae bacterium]
MSPLRRRSLLTSGVATLFAPKTRATPASDVSFLGDGLSLSPPEYVRLLGKVAEQTGVHADDFSRGGLIEQVEKRFAELLGKERAVFFPTGTLANHVGVRLLAGEKRRVLIQAESHLYNDSGDCVQTLSNLNLVPLAPGRATFTLDEVAEQVERGDASRVFAPVGAISIESPVRRKSGEAFDYGEMKRIAAYARGKGIKLHLDGARLFLASPFTGVSVKQYAGLFDTVYVSLYKYFNAASGAVLAGPRALLDDVYHLRRTFGAGLPHSWPIAAVALHFVDGFEQRYTQAAANVQNMLKRLADDSRFGVDQAPGATHIVRLRVAEADPKALVARLEQRGIAARAPAKAGEPFLLNINESALRRSGDDLAAAFRQAAG